TMAPPVPGTWTPLAVRTRTVEAGVPVPVKVTVREGTVAPAAGVTAKRREGVAGSWTTRATEPSALPPVVCWRLRCSVAGALAAKVPVVVHTPSAPTAAGAVPGTWAPLAVRTRTVEAGVPVPVKVTVREGTVPPATGPVTAKRREGVACSWTTRATEPSALPPVVCWRLRCSVAGALAAKVPVVVHTPSAPTAAGAVPGTWAPLAVRTRTVEAGVPVPVKVTVREGTVPPATGPVTAKRREGVAGSWTTRATEPSALPPVVCWRLRCSVAGALAAKVPVVVHTPSAPTAAGAVPGTWAPLAVRTRTVEAGVPVPVKVTVREGTVPPATGPVTAKRGEAAAWETDSPTMPVPNVTTPMAHELSSRRAMDLGARFERLGKGIIGHDLH